MPKFFTHSKTPSIKKTPGGCPLTKVCFCLFTQILLKKTSSNLSKKVIKSKHPQCPGVRHRCGCATARTDGESDRESQESGEFQKINSLKSPEESLEVPKCSVVFCVLGCQKWGSMVRKWVIAPTYWYKCGISGWKKPTDPKLLWTSSGILETFGDIRFQSRKKSNGWGRGEWTMRTCHEERKLQAHTIHVWYIYLLVNVGKYTIHGSLGKLSWDFFLRPLFW